MYREWKSGGSKQANEGDQLKKNASGKAELKNGRQGDMKNGNKSPESRNRVVSVKSGVKGGQNYTYEKSPELKSVASNADKVDGISGEVEEEAGSPRRGQRVVEWGGGDREVYHNKLNTVGDARSTEHLRSSRSMGTLATNNTAVKRK